MCVDVLCGVVCTGSVCVVERCYSKIIRYRLQFCVCV